MNKFVCGYEIKEPTIGDVPEIFEAINNDGKMDMGALTQALMANCLCKDSRPIGPEGVKEIPIKNMTELTKALLAAAGLNKNVNEDGQPGKDFPSEDDLSLGSLTDSVAQ